MSKASTCLSVLTNWISNREKRPFRQWRAASARHMWVELKNSKNSMLSFRQQLVYFAPRGTLEPGAAPYGVVA